MISKLGIATAACGVAATVYAFELNAAPFLSVPDDLEPHHGIQSRLAVGFNGVAAVSTSSIVMHSVTISGLGGYPTSAIDLATVNANSGFEITTEHAGRETAAKPPKPAFIKAT